MSCPNKNLQSYKDLVSRFGEVKALIAFKLNSDDIPSVSRAEELLNTAVQPLVSDNIINYSDDPKYKLYREYAEANDGQSLLKAIVDKTKDDDTRMLASILLQIPNINKLQINLVKDLNKDMLGVYNLYSYEKTNVIKILDSLGYPAFETVALHEIIHGITEGALRKNEKFYSKVMELYSHVLEFRNKESKVRPGKTISSYYGMTDEHEFMAEALSNPEFMKELTQISSPFKGQTTKRNAFEAFIELIVSLFNRNKNFVKDNVFTALVSTIGNYAKIVEVSSTDLLKSKTSLTSLNDFYKKASEQYKFNKNEGLSKFKAERIADAIRTNPEYSGWFAKITPVVDENGDVKYKLDILPNTIKAATEQTKEFSSKKSINDFMNTLLPKFEGVSYEWVKASDLVQSEHAFDISEVNAYVKGKTIYLVEGRVNRDTVIEELLHPFVEGLYQQNRALFVGLLNEIRNTYPELAFSIKDRYGNTTSEEDVAKEIVTRGIQAALKDELATNEARTLDQLRYLLSRFFNWLNEVIENVFGVNTNNYGIELHKLPSTITLSELGKIINTQDIQLETAFINNTVYNVSEMEEDDKKFGSRQRNISRIEDQITMLDDVMSNMLDDSDIKKLETLQTLKDKLEGHLQDIKDGKTTVSVTKLKGGGALDLFNQNPKFQNFGTFLHSGIEKLQKQYLDDPSILPSRRVDEKFVDDLLEDELGKDESERFTVQSGTTSDITNLNKLEVLSMMRALLQHYESYITQGYTIIPEITVVGTDKSGRTVIGRIDTLAVGKDGSVRIIDLKTKKLNNETAWANIQQQLEKTYRIEASADSDADFFLTPQMANRNAYQEWDIQLGIYEQMFKQMGINVAHKEILALLYLGDNTYVNMPDSLSNVYDFVYKSYMPIVHHSSVEYYNTVSEKLAYEKYQATVRKVVPIKDEKTAEEKKQQANIIFNLTEEQKKNIVDRLNSLLDDEINKVTSTIRKYKQEGLAESEMVKSLSEKNETLKKVRDTMKRDNWDTAYKLSLTLQFLDESYDNLTKTITEIKKIDDNTEKAQQLDALKRRATGLNYFIDELERTLISADPEQNKEARAVIGRIKSNMQSVAIAYNELGADYMIKILMNMEGTRRATVMTDQRRQSIEPRLKYLKDKLDRLKKNTPGVKDMKDSVAYWALGSMKNLINGLQNVPGQELNEIKKIELDIKTLELELQGIKLEPAELKKYIDGILDSSSLLYIGKGVNITADVLAAAGHSDLGISSFANYLKLAQQDAQKEYVNFIERNKFQEELDKFMGPGETVIDASKRITETRTITEKDEEGNDVETQVLSYIDPIQQEWRNTFRDYYNDLRAVNQEIREAGTDTEKKIAIKKKANLTETHRKWSLEHAQMPLVKEVYELENFLPSEYRIRRREILDEISDVKARRGKDNEELLTDEDRNDIANLEVELQRLKIDLLKDDVKYNEYIEKLEKYYSFDTNWNFFNRLKNSKLIQYGGENSEDFKKWMAENTIKVANQQYYEELEEIYEEMFSILDQDQETKDIRDQQRAILAKVKRRGYADVRFLTEDEKEDYMNFEAIMQELREGAVKQELSDDEYERLGELRMRLGAIRTFTTNPYYQLEYSQKKQALDQKYALYKQAEEAVEADDSDVNRRNLELLLNDYYATENIFENWYNQNHYDIYESRLFADKPLNPKPLPFNVISLPTNEKHFDVKPTSKYSLRKIKPAAKNENYQTDVYGVPMPNALRRDETTGTINMVDQTSKWINPAYKLLAANQKDFDFYNFFVNKFIQTQSETYGNTLGYMVPGYEEESILLYREKGIKKGIKDNFDIWKQKNFTVNNPYDYNHNEYSTDIERIRFKHNKPLPITEQSRNAIGCVLKWYEEAFINKNVGQIQPEVNAAISYMESLYSQLENSNMPDKEIRKKELQKVISTMRFEYNKIIKGESKLNQGALSRIGDFILKGVGLTRMGLDIPNQIGNMFSGNVQTFLGMNMVKGGQYAHEDMVWSKKKIWGRNGLMNSLVDDISKISGKSHMTNMYLYFNPMQQLLQDKVDKSLSRADRVKESILDLEFAFWIQDKGEVEISSTIWLSMMHNRKVELTKPDGTKEMIPMFEAYESTKDGEIMIRKDVNWTKQDEAEFFRNMYSEIRRTQGNYALTDKTSAEQGVLGRFGMFFRKYLAPSIQNRFGSRRENHEGSEIAMGYYNGLYHAIKYYGYGQVFKSMFSKNTKVEPFYRQRVIWAAREVAASIVLMLIGNALSSLVAGWGDDDDELSVRKILVYNMLAVYLKVERETRGLVPLPGVGGFEGYLTQLSSFTNAGSDFVKLGKLVAHGGALALAQVPIVGEDDWIQRGAYYQAKSGYFEEGDNKITKDLMDVSAVSNVYNILYPVSTTKGTFKRR